MKKVILPLLVGFLLIAICTIASNAQTKAPSKFEVESFQSLGSDSSLVRTETEEVKNVVITYNGKRVVVIGKCIIFLFPKKDINNKNITQFNIFKLKDGSIISVRKEDIDQGTTTRLATISKNYGKK